MDMVNADLLNVIPMVSGFRSLHKTFYSPFGITVPNAFSDWISDAQIIKTELGKLGIDVKTETPSVASWTNDLDVGSFDTSLTYGVTYYNPYFYYYYTLDGANATPIGTVTTSNYERYKNPQVDQLLNSYLSLTSQSKQVAVIDQLQKVMLTQVPVIPMFYNANWNQYSTKYFTDYPSASNPYATPTYSWPDVQVEFTHLKVK